MLLHNVAEQLHVRIVEPFTRLIGSRTILRKSQRINRWRIAKVESRFGDIDTKGLRNRQMVAMVGRREGDA
jgi:hypothetical protein